jgi:hypothetical protein
MEPLFNSTVYHCHCNWCGNDWDTTDLITNLCADCRTIATRAYDAALDQIKREHGR